MVKLAFEVPPDLRQPENCNGKEQEDEDLGFANCDPFIYLTSLFEFSKKFK